MSPVTYYSGNDHDLFDGKAFRSEALLTEAALSGYETTWDRPILLSLVDSATQAATTVRIEQAEAIAIDILRDCQLVRRVLEERAQVVALPEKR